MSYLIPGYSDFFIEQQVIVLLAGYFSLERRSVMLESKLWEELGVDPDATFKVVSLLNEAFGVSLPMEAAAQWGTVADVCRLVGNAREYRA